MPNPLVACSAVYESALTSKSSKRVTQSKLMAVLAAGFGLAIVVLVSAGFVGIGSLHEIRDISDRLVQEQLVTDELIDKIQRQQDALSGIYYSIPGEQDYLDRAQVLHQVDEVEAAFRRILAAVPESSEQGLWFRSV